MIPSMLGAVACDSFPRTAVRVDTYGVTPIPAGAVYASMFWVDAGAFGYDGSASSGGTGGRGGACRAKINQPVAGHTGVFVNPGATTLLRWDSSAGTTITAAISYAGGSGGTGGSGHLAGGGGGAGGPAGPGSNGGSGGTSARGQGGQAGPAGSIVEMYPTSVSGDGGNGRSLGHDWGGGGGGGDSGNEGRLGGIGGCLLLFTAEPVTI